MGGLINPMEDVSEGLWLYTAGCYQAPRRRSIVVPSTAIFLANFAGANNSTTFIDSAEGGIITPHGNVKIQTAGGQHGLFGGSGDYLSVARGAGWHPGSTYAIECFVSVQSSSGTLVAQWEGNTGSSNNAFSIYFYGGSLYFSYSPTGGGWANISTAFTPAIGQMYHIVAEHDGTYFRFWIDGVNVYSGAIAVQIFAGSNADLVIGRLNGYSFDLDGSMFAVRISLSAIYATGILPTAPSFTPPSLPLV